jgi:hypothetical protein
MPLTQAHSFLVPPFDRSGNQSPINGTLIPAGDAMWTQLGGLYTRANDECNIGIKFMPAPSGQQENPRRALLVSYVQSRDLEHGRQIAEHLRTATTRRSGIGLLFLLLGSDTSAALVIARFAMNEGVLAKESTQGRLQVEFVREIFMKNVLAYKSVVYPGPAVGGAFWRGKAVDKQLKATGSSSDYWIREFLMSELETAGPAGTKRLARALRNAIKSGAPAIKSELTSFAQLLRNQQGNIITPIALAENMGLTAAALEALTQSFPRRDGLTESFQFDSEEFDRQIGFRYVELDNGARLIADDEAFNRIFEESELTDDRRRYSTEGRVVKTSCETCRDGSASTLRNPILQGLKALRRAASSFDRRSHRW